MMPHTEGPWLWNYLLSVRAAASGIKLADCDPDIALPLDEAIANARLMATSPELLEAIEDLLATAAVDEENCHRLSALVDKARGQCQCERHNLNPNLREWDMTDDCPGA